MLTGFATSEPLEIIEGHTKPRIVVSKKSSFLKKLLWYSHTITGF